MKIVLVDCNYVEPEFASSYLLVQDGRGFFVECNTNHAIPYLVEAAKKEGLSVDQIDGLLITHVHLDHAGGAGLFLKTFPQASLYAHPRAAKHAIDPTRLVEGATAVYGVEFMKRMYGHVLACSAARVRALNDGDFVEWKTGVSHLRFPTHHLLGHAPHHLCMIEPETKTLFSGDTFGVSYPKLNQKQGLIVIPSTSPTGFDGPEAIRSVNWIRDTGMKQVALTHYGFLAEAELPEAAKQLVDQLLFSMELVVRAKNEKWDEDEVLGSLRNWTLDYFASKNKILDSDDLKHLSIDLRVNAQGLHFAAHQERSHR